MAARAWPGAGPAIVEPLDPASGPANGRYGAAGDSGRGKALARASDEESHLAARILRALFRRGVDVSPTPWPHPIGRSRRRMMPRWPSGGPLKPLKRTGSTPTRPNPVPVIMAVIRPVGERSATRPKVGDEAEGRRRGRRSARRAGRSPLRPARLTLHDPGHTLPARWPAIHVAITVEGSRDGPT
jgi:hypothetical protein